MRIRQAAAADAAAINSVYNPYILLSPATFETEPYSVEARLAWLEERDSAGRHPVFVAEDPQSRQLQGFANAAPFDQRDGYRTSVKTSVFVAPQAQGRGAGQALYKALFAALAHADVHRAYALIVAPNPASAALHERFGFSHVATLNEVGRKFDRFHDVMWFEKRL